LALHILKQTRRRKANILPKTLQKKHMQIYISGKLVTSEVPINHQKMYRVRKVISGSTLSILLNSIVWSENLCLIHSGEKRPSFASFWS